MQPEHSLIVHQGYERPVRAVPELHLPASQVIHPPSHLEEVQTHRRAVQGGIADDEGPIYIERLRPKRVIVCGKEVLDCFVWLDDRAVETGARIGDCHGVVFKNVLQIMQRWTLEEAVGPNVQVTSKQEGSSQGFRQTNISTLLTRPNLQSPELCRTRFGCAKAR